MAPSVVSKFNTLCQILLVGLVLGQQVGEGGAKLFGSILVEASDVGGFDLADEEAHSFGMEAFAVGANKAGGFFGGEAVVFAQDFDSEFLEVEIGDFGKVDREALVVFGCGG